MAKQARTVWDESKSTVENARVVLPKLAAAYLEAGRKLTVSKPSARALHQFRLETKRFRYSLELFQRCYGPGLEARLEVLRQFQQYLGDINDCVVAQRLLLGGKSPHSKRATRLSKLLAGKVAAKTVGLLDCLERNLLGARRRRWWIDYLARYAGRNKKAPARGNRRRFRAIERMRCWRQGGPMSP